MSAQLFEWCGSTRLRHTIMRSKRNVSAAEGEIDCAWDLKRWVFPPQDDVLRAAWHKLSQPYAAYLREFPRSARASAVARIVWRFLFEEITFSPEADGADFWQFPPETLALRSGDCEDQAFLAASLLLAAGIRRDDVRVVIGALYRPQHPSQRQLLGHAWPSVRDESGRWRILETNLDQLPVADLPEAAGAIEAAHVHEDIHPARLALLDADELARDHRVCQFIPLLCLNDRNVWTVQETVPGRVEAARLMHPDWSEQPTFRDLWQRERRLPHELAEPVRLQELLA